MGFTASDADPCLFSTGKGTQRVYVLVHVDDGLIIGAKKTVQAALAAIAGAFDIKDIGEAVYFLGLEIHRDRTRGLLRLGQPKYARSILERFGMENCKAVVTPLEANVHLGRGQGEAVTDEFPYAELVGSLLYLTVNTRPDLAHAASVLSRFMSCATQEHWKAAKRVLRYIAGSLDRGLVYTCGAPLIEVYTDSDYAGDPDSCKSTSGAVVLSRGGAVVWGSKLQTVAAASTCEAEYVAAAAAVKEVLWLRKLMGEMSGEMSREHLYGDDQTALVIMQQHTPGAAGRTKHIDVAYHFVRHTVLQGDIEAVFVKTEDMKADMLTKAVPGPRQESGAAGTGLQMLWK